jgi:hypothetical protein
MTSRRDAALPPGAGGCAEPNCYGAIEKQPLRSQSDAALRAAPCHSPSVVLSLAPRAVAAAETSDWKVRTIPSQTRTAFDLATEELFAALCEAPAAVPLIASAEKARSAATVPRRPLVMYILHLPVVGETPPTESASHWETGGFRPSS